MTNDTVLSPEASSAWNLPRVLRGIGAIVLILSLSSFLLQGWHLVDDVTRYLMLLAETIVLCVAGVISIKWLNEPHGARTFVGLTLIAVPVNFAILGGMIYSPYIAGSGLSETIPEYLRWHASDLVTALLVAAGSMLALLPMIVVGYQIMARNSARALSSLFIILNAALLLPVRTGIVMDIALLALTVLALTQLYRMHVRDPGLKTPGGRFARASIFIPIGILFGRTLWIYGGDIFMSGIASLAAFLIVRHVSVMLDKDSAWRSVVNIASLFPAYAAISYISDAIFAYINMGTSLQLPLMSVAMGAVLIDCSFRSLNSNAYLRLAAISAVAGAILGLFLHATTLNVIWVMLIGIGTIIYASSVKQKSAFALGIATTATGLIYELHGVFSHFDFGSWGAMAVIGVLTVLSASIIERHGEAIKSRLRVSYERFSDWEY
jgi:hypothetical protein